MKERNSIFNRVIVTKCVKIVTLLLVEFNNSTKIILNMMSKWFFLIFHWEHSLCLLNAIELTAYLFGMLKLLQQKTCTMSFITLIWKIWFIIVISYSFYHRIYQDEVIIWMKCDWQLHLFKLVYTVVNGNSSTTESFIPRSIHRVAEREKKINVCYL